RAIDQVESRLIPESGDVCCPFFSPDGVWLGFVGGGKLKKIFVMGGEASILCDVLQTRGASWADNNTIIFAPSPRSPLFQVLSSGGTPQPLTTLDTQKNEGSHRYPFVLPSSQAVMFTVLRSDREPPQVVLQSL